MKKGIVLLAAVCLLAAAAPAQSLSLAVRGGMGWASGGDLHRGLRGLMDYYAAAYDGLTGEHAFPRLGWAAGGEILMHLSQRLAVGIGAGYERHVKESLVGYGIGSVEVSETLSPSVDVIPITAGLHLFLPLGSAVKLDVAAGAGAYLARLKWTSSYAISLLGYSGTDVFAFQGSRWGFGAQAGLGLEWALSESLSAVFHVSGRLAGVQGFRGDWSETGSGDFWSFAESGSGYKLYAYDWTTGGATYPQLVFQADTPAGASVSNAREARLDLTGVTASVGLRVRLL